MLVVIVQLTTDLIKYLVSPNIWLCVICIICYKSTGRFFLVCVSQFTQVRAVKRA